MKDSILCLNQDFLPLPLIALMQIFFHIFLVKTEKSLLALSEATDISKAY